MSRCLSVRVLMALSFVLTSSLASFNALAAPPNVPAGSTHQWLPASPDKLPRWRGFNLLEKFQLKMGRQPFSEKDFQLIQKLGFNFVRLPMDYRFWIVEGNWEKFDESVLKEIDQAVEWGNKYGIHVCINFHRAPGFTVAKPEEKTSLWTDPETQRVCALHWATFARRYKGIPSARLSFNLLNEPRGVKREVFIEVMGKLVKAIHDVDPGRLIISDGLETGRDPIAEFKTLGIAQATRGYAPGEISHYKASWVKSENFPDPQWPKPGAIPGTLLSPKKPEGANIVVIEGPFAKQTQLRLRVQKVSQQADLVVEADEKPVFTKAFKCGPGEGEWKKAEFMEKYKIYQNTYDKDYTATIPAGAAKVRMLVAAGDWLQLSEIGLKPEGAAREDTLKMEASFSRKAEPFKYAPGAKAGPFAGIPMRDRQWLWKNSIEPWKKAQEDGIGVFVGEWGCYNKTPHDVVLRWAEDCLVNWQKAEFGWAMWNFRGSFGILDSGRADVQYEDFEGHKLDRKLLELLQKY